MTEIPTRPAPVDLPGASRPELFSRSGSNALMVALASGAGLFLAWQTAGPLLLIFTGLLFAAFLDAVTRGLAYALPIRRGWRLSIVCALLVLGTAGLLAWGGYNLIQQADYIVGLTGDQLRILRGELRAIGITPPPGPGAPRTLTQFLLPDPDALFGQAYTAFSLASGLLGNAVVVLFIGLFAATSPETYRGGLLMLLPHRRQQRVGEVLDEMADVLRWWVVSQLLAMVVIALSTWAGLALIGMPGAFVLGMQAGLVNIIPYLGPVIATIPILLAALAQDTSMVIWAMGVHFVVQSLEGYVLAPLIHARTVDLPPLLALAAVLLFGALFGVMGAALATPLVAVLKVAVARFYVEDRLGGN